MAMTETAGLTSSLVGTGDLFQLLRDGKPRTRGELARLSSLARSTITTRVDALLASGLLEPVGEAASTGGRPPTRFALNRHDRVVLAVDLGASHASVAVMDLGGQLLEHRTVDCDIADGPDAVLDLVASIGRELLGELGREVGDVAGVGIGVPGPVAHATGRPANPPIMPGWHDVDVPALLGRHFDGPVLVDNDVNLMALGEYVTSWSATSHLLLVKVATGIGAGVISGGVLQRGAQGTAGDIGHINVNRGADVPCQCGNRGCLEALASGPAIGRILTAEGMEAQTSADVVALVKQGNLQAIQAVRQAGRDIGEVLTACVSLMNPQVIVIGGSIAQAGEHIIAGAREVVYARSIPLATESLHIVQSRTGADAAIVGAALLALDHALSFSNVENMILANDSRVPSTVRG